MTIDIINSLNITSFTSEQSNAHNENLVITGRCEIFFNQVNKLPTTTPLSAQEKQAVIASLFRNLSLVMSTQGPYRGKCESLLKNSIYSTCQRNLNSETATYVTTLIDQPGYTYNSQLIEVIEKVGYLLKSRFISEKKNWFLWETKFAHHLGKTVGNLSTMSKGAAYLVAGAAFSVTGLNKFYSDDPTKGNNPQVGIAALSIGITLMGAPFLSAIQSSGTNNP